MRIHSVATLVLTTVLSLSTAFGQLTRGNISGVLQDQTGAVIVNATVKIHNKATNLERETTTNEAGLYRFVGVDPGTYAIEFSMSGFEVKKIDGITVGTTQEVTINQTMTIGSTSAAVEVRDNPPGVELSKTTATIERTLPQNFIQNVPLTAGTRDINQLALL